MQVLVPNLERILILKLPKPLLINFASIKTIFKYIILEFVFYI